jgi:sporulation-control protein spo0M
LFCLKKLLSSIDIGSARMDTKLTKARYSPSETVKGIVEIHRGNVEQQIDEIDRKARGLSGLLAESLNMDETLIRFTYDSNDLPSLPQFLMNTINRYC